MADAGKLRLHLDTDLGSDPDDACALAMLLGMPDVDLVGVTTTIDPGGIRAGMVHEVLALGGRDDVPVAAGAEVSLTTRRTPGGTRPANPGGRDLSRRARRRRARRSTCWRRRSRPARPWPQSARTRTSRCWRRCGPERWLGLRSCSWAAGSAGRWRTAIPRGTRATTGTCSATSRPRASCARQAKAQGADSYAGFGARYARLPDDLVNVHHDPLACAVATGWGGARGRVCNLAAVEEDGVLRFEASPDGRPVRVVDGVDAEAFREHWFACLDRLRPGGGADG